MNLQDKRIWFRFTCKTINILKGNTSSTFRNNMQCRHCISGEVETQEHVEKREFTKVMRKTLNLENEEELYRKANLNYKGNGEKK